MTKPKSISERNWNLPKLRRWLIKQGITDNKMPHLFSIFDTENIYNPVNQWRFCLGDDDVSRLQTIAFIVIAHGGNARVEYNMLHVIKDSLYLWKSPITTTWSYVFIDMKGEPIAND